MKALYAKYKDSGVEFVGVSLDDPEEKVAKAKLLAYIKENQVPWPQYYEGKPQSKLFAASLAVTGIPAKYVIDSAGILRSADAGERLEEVITALIPERDGTD